MLAMASEVRGIAASGLATPTPDAAGWGQFISLGYFIGESTTPNVTPKDLVIVISRTGETYSAIQTANIVRRVGAKLVVVTGRKGSKLAHAGNIVHFLTLTSDEKRQRLAPLGTLFEITSLLFFDCMVAELMARLGESEESMRGRHAIWV
jgi:6-phospho-3-hexuloisomerase